MKNLNRRDFFKTAAFGISAATLGASSVKGADNMLSEDRIGVLVDTDVCVGCRHCEWACRVAHNLPTPRLITTLTIRFLKNSEGLIQLR
jgi:NAD-dependent dihydropyrimidine dehydrogenase PreA subunit